MFSAAAASAPYPARTRIRPDETTRRAFLEGVRARRGARWRTLSRELASAIDSVHRNGFCWASWQPQVVAVATPIVVKDQPIYVLNMSMTGDVPPGEVLERLREPLRMLARQLHGAIEQLA